MQCFMNKMLHEYIPNVTMPFLDNIPTQGCLERGKYETVDANRCQIFVIYNTNDCKCILKKIEWVQLKLSRKNIYLSTKWSFDN